LPINLPAGWDFAKLFGERQRVPAAQTERRADAGDARAPNARAQLAALKHAPDLVAPASVQLPKTATDAEWKMIAGAILLTLGLMLLAFNKRRRFAH
jgi:Ca-activated chloride channel family protein